MCPPCWAHPFCFLLRTSQKFLSFLLSTTVLFPLRVNDPAVTLGAEAKGCAGTMLAQATWPKAWGGGFPCVKPVFSPADAALWFTEMCPLGMYPSEEALHKAHFLSALLKQQSCFLFTLYGERPVFLALITSLAAAADNHISFFLFFF